MVLPIQTQLAHTSNTIKIMSLGLTSMSSLISSLGGLLSGAFGAGLTAFEGLSGAMSGFFEEQIQGAKNLAKVLRDLNLESVSETVTETVTGIMGGGSIIPKSTGEAISNVISGGGLGSKPSLGSGINDSNRHLFKFTPKENTFRFPNLSHDGKQNHTSILDIFGGGGPARHSDFSDRVKMGMAMSRSSPTYNINIEMSGMTDRSDKRKMAVDISDLIQAETTRRADFHRSHGRL
jgi:hypothetical protein